MSGQTVTFLPIVSVTRRNDGRWNVHFDWADSCDSADKPISWAACEAIDEWVKSQPKTIIIH